MKNYFVLVCTLLLLLGGHAANASDADITQDFIKCAQTKKDGARLQCFDAITARIIKENSPQTTGIYSQYQKMDLVDFKTDAKSLSGKKVAVTGMLQMFAGVAMLKTEALDATPVMVGIDHLPRGDRHHIFDACSSICSVEVFGRVQPGALGSQITADRLAW